MMLSEETSAGRPQKQTRFNGAKLVWIVMGFAVVVSFAYVLVNLVVDLLYLWIDPRIGRGGGE
ncbi:hypothetical protein C2M81_003361 [Escherichia coli]|nr:hypothetical protein [Escherichia coli]